MYRTEARTLIKRIVIASATVFTLVVLTGCKTTKTYTDFHAPLQPDKVVRVTIEIQTDTIRTHSITAQQEIQAFIKDLNSAQINGVWKGANWSKIVLHYSDREMVFNTNGKVFGPQLNGQFYELNDKYNQYWK